MKKCSKFLSLFLVIISLFSFVTTANAANEPENLEVDANIALLINLDDANKKVLYSKNSDLQSAPASLTKIATAATAFSMGVDLDATTTVSYNAIHALDGTGSSMANLVEGEELTLRQVMYLIMLHSAGDACNVLAEHMAGDIDAYVAKMNEWVKSIGCENTNFVNPVGIDADNHYSTAEDLAKITMEATNYPEFAKISTTPSYKMDATNKRGEQTFTHRNSMLNKATGYYYKYASGIKTGTTTNAGRCVITTASKDGYNYLCIVMQGILKDYTADGLEDNGAFFDAKHLFEWAFNNFRFKTIADATQVVSSIKVKNGKDTDTLQLVPKESVSSLVPTSLDASAVIVKLDDNVPKEVGAPVKKGDSMGTGQIIYAGEVIGKIELAASKDVERSIPLLIINTIKDMMSTVWAKIIVLLIILLIFVYIGITIYYNVKRKKKKMKAVKKYRSM